MQPEILSLSSPISCALPESQVIKGDAAFEAALQLSPFSQGRQFFNVDMSEFFCIGGYCPPVIGGLLVYGMGQHQAPLYNQSLSPYLRQKLLALPGFTGL